MNKLKTLKTKNSETPLALYLSTQLFDISFGAGSGIHYSYVVHVLFHNTCIRVCIYLLHSIFYYSPVRVSSNSCRSCSIVSLFGAL